MSIRSFSRSFCYLVALVLLSSSSFSTSASSQQASKGGAAAYRPASVPNDFVATPFGFFHPSCVASLAKGEKLLPDRRIVHSDGSVEPDARVCDYPHFTASGSQVDTSAAKDKPTGKTSNEPEISGWLENANITTNSPSRSYGALIAWWLVPSSPRANDGQVLYFFPGLEDINDPNTSILQPVLEWVGGQWTITSWNCCLSGIVVASTPVNVSSGDLIYGSMTNTCGKGALTCATWNVLTLDVSTGQSTTLADTPSDGQVFNWAFGGVLEPYYVDNCDDYPPDKRIEFEGIALFDQNLRPIRDLKWSAGSNSTGTPQCGYGAKGVRDTVTLDYGTWRRW